MTWLMAQAPLHLCAGLKDAGQRPYEMDWACWSNRPQKVSISGWVTTLTPEPHRYLKGRPRHRLTVLAQVTLLEGDVTLRTVWEKATSLSVSARTSLLGCLHRGVAPEALSGRHERAGGDHDVVFHNDLVHDMAPIPTSTRSPTVHPCNSARWPIVTSSPMCSANPPGL